MDFIDAYGDLLMGLRRLVDREGEHRQTGRQLEIQGFVARACSIMTMILDDPEALE